MKIKEINIINAEELKLEEIEKERYFWVDFDEYKIEDIYYCNIMELKKVIEKGKGTMIEVEREGE